MPSSAPNLPKNLLCFEGGSALPAWRAQVLLLQLQSVSVRITGVEARHLHWVLAEVGETPDTDKLAALLRYGDAYTGGNDGTVVLVMPRLGTVSPWASKATDIARNCGLLLHRVERVTEYRLQLKQQRLGAERRERAAALETQQVLGQI